MNIVLLGINARYSHTSLGLRYIKANLKEYKNSSTIIERTINEDVYSISEEILSYKPKIVGMGTYIWNALVIKRVSEIIKKVLPETYIILGGPEVSHFPLRIEFKYADFIVMGEGEEAFYRLCKDILTNNNVKRDRFVTADVVDTKKIELPYDEYGDEDIKHRHIYVESSRGCPFACEFCLSAIDKGVRYFDLDKILEEFEKLWHRGVRKFKFIDRTFNLNIKFAIKLLDFFLSKNESYSLHFEVVPDNFPNRLKQKLRLFPQGCLQLEIGLQSLNTKILSNINRKMNIEKTKANIEFLEKYTNTHLHLDLIIGLPGENLDSFANNLNELKSITDSEIQLGVLKKLSGTTISRWDKVYDMLYSDEPPYEIIQNSLISFEKMQEMKRFARFWDIFYNSGNFHKTKDFIWQNSTVFDSFLDFSRWIYCKTKATYQISLMRQCELLFDYLTSQKKCDKKVIADSILEDIIKVEGRKVPGFLHKYLDGIPNLKRLYINKAQKRQMLRG